MISSTETTKLANRLAKQKYITVYKELYANEDKLESMLCDYQWQPGINKSSRKTTKLVDSEKLTEEIELGFHVYLTKTGKAADTVLVRFQAKAKDFVAAGLFHEAVFTKLTLSKTEYNKALGTKKHC
jgi:hypothetical protein